MGRPFVTRASTSDGLSELLVLDVRMGARFGR